VVAHKHYIGNFAVYEVKNNVGDMSYLHTDHLGSVMATSKSAVNTTADVTKIANDSWGKRTNGSWIAAALGTGYVPPVTTHGFTGHEHLDGVGLIHMNGRVYDPLLGRFLSADPIVQAPHYSQSFNRYAYVMNNPLSLVDPSGFQSVCITTSSPGEATCTEENQGPDGATAQNDVEEITITGTRRRSGGSSGFGGGDGLFGVHGSGDWWEAQMSSNGSSLPPPQVTVSCTPPCVWTDENGDINIFGGFDGGSLLGGEGTPKEAASPRALGAVLERIIGNLGGRLGNEVTRAHIRQVAKELEARGWGIRNGGARKGSSYPDITAVKGGKTLRVNTVDTRADGITPTTREAANAARIREQTGEHLLLIPKP
jgi:RHS repeat-associated protein